MTDHKHSTKADRELGPCGKHPNVFWIDECHHCCQFLETNGKLPHDCKSHCAICAEADLARAEALRQAIDLINSCGGNEHSDNLRKSIRALLTQSAADALAAHDREQHEIGQQTAEALVQSYCNGGGAAFVHELTEPAINLFAETKLESVYGKVRKLITQMEVATKTCCMFSPETGDCIARNIVEDWTDQLSAILPPAEERDDAENI